ncbi:MAG: hypothetical protein P4L74_07245 [Candidatus Doudnabacteria bacterium]|nr:hypothetical protein [Candidatus Doudnabacteria bacterium]
MKKIIIVLSAIFSLAAGCQSAIVTQTPPAKPGACTLEAKQCPDGSYVGRSGPNCEFAACPEPKATTTPTQPPSPVVCPQIALACPDGSYVKPEGPNCKIPDCPTLTSGIEGKITLGPTCPVERMPPDPNCADKPYQAMVIVKTADGQKEITRFTSQTDGTFKQALKPGTYLLVSVSAQVYPRGVQQTVIVNANTFSQVTISYDTGIR